MIINGETYMKFFPERTSHYARYVLYEIWNIMTVDHIHMLWHFTHHAYIRYKKTSSTTTQVWQDSNSYDEYKCWIYFWNVIVNQMTCDRWFSKNLHQQKLCLFYGLTFRVIIRRSIFKMKFVLCWLNINITFYWVSIINLSISFFIEDRTFWFYLSFICK